MEKICETNIVTISGNKIKSIYSSLFLSTCKAEKEKKAKSKKGIKIWTFINVQKRKSENSFENGLFFRGLLS